jgi:hypothetical protein
MSKCQVKLSVCFHPVASLALIDPSFGSISTKVSETFCLTILPTLERVASHGSTISGSSDKTTVRFLPAEYAGEKKAYNC